MRFNGRTVIKPSYKDVATGHKFIIKKHYGVKRGVVTKVFVMPYRMTPDINSAGL